MLTAWYEPDLNGDIRLEQHPEDENRSILTVEDPTPDELERLSSFLNTARGRKTKGKPWVDGFRGIAADGRTELTLGAPVLKAGKALMGWKWNKRGTITAVKTVDGVVTAVGVEPDKEKTAAKEADEATSDKKADKAVTTRRPTLCCPTCVEGPEVRANTVLEAFLTDQQRQDWLSRGWMIVYGNLTGFAYRVAHRHSRMAIAQGKPCWDLDNGHLMHCHEAMLPPAEEVLSIKLTLENFEHWIRNASGCLLGGTRFYDPFCTAAGQGLDGTWDAGQIAGMGRALRLFGLN